jgi:hypothetical protein
MVLWNFRKIKKPFVLAFWEKMEYNKLQFQFIKFAKSESFKLGKALGSSKIMLSSLHPWVIALKATTFKLGKALGSKLSQV